MDLIPYMYHERQEEGSQLCAQHCLNNILQQHTYSEFDLADIAQKLDQAENAALSATRQNKKSYNLDDTGFFSISVLERALQVWDLTLVRWRGEAMKPYQKHPEDQAAFILNLSQHWLPLRRFSTSPPHASASKRWYNLNSFLAAPEWVSPTYLRMVLEEAEKEGYSVFVVRKAGGGQPGTDMSEGEGWGDGGVGVLPECLADTMAVELGEPVGRGGNLGNVTSGVTAGPSQAPSGVNPDQPSVDPSPPTLAGPSSPPRSRRKRQEDLFDPSAQAGASNDPFLAQPSTSRGNPPTGGFGMNGRQADEDEDIPDAAASSGEGDEEYADAYGGPADFTHYQRSYDDEDAALQAALKASMEDVPSDWVAPDLSKKNEVLNAGMDAGRRSLPTPPIPVATPAASSAQAAPPAVEKKNWRPAGEVKKAESPKSPVRVKEDKEAAASPPQSPLEELTPDEIRKRRLARFG